MREAEKVRMCKKETSTMGSPSLVPELSMLRGNV